MVAVTAHNTLGAVFIGGWVTAISYGITCVQAISFLRHPANQKRKIIWWTVIMLWLTDTIHSVFVSKTLYWYLVQNFGISDVSSKYPWSLMVSLVMDNISDTIVRSFFTYRVWILSKKNRPLTLILGSLVVLVPVTGLVSTGIGFTHSSFMEFDHIGWLMMLTFTSAVVADVLIAAALVFCLLQSRSKSMSADCSLFHRTDSLINGLVVYVINTGLLTCLASFLCLLFFLVYSHTFIFLAFHFPMSPIYVNALLGSFNARTSMQLPTIKVTRDDKYPRPSTSFRTDGATLLSSGASQRFCVKESSDPDHAFSVGSDDATLCGKDSNEGTLVKKTEELLSPTVEEAGNSGRGSFSRDSSIAVGVVTVSPV